MGNSHLAEFPSDKICVENQTHILCPINFFPKIVLLLDKMAGYGRAGRATDDKMIHAHYTLHTKGYKHTLRIYQHLQLFYCNNG